MPKKMLIDATHPEETRVAVVSGRKLEEFDQETASKRPIRGNIYLAKVTRVEPSLQAAFVSYGGNRHGFLAFGEIHPDYYRIPVADRSRLLEEAKAAEGAAEGAEDDGADAEEGSGPDPDGGDAAAASRPRYRHRYKIQEVIKRNQIMLVQAVKEERGGKGAAMTTYLSLAGRYCVLMPNTDRGGGVSRKITDAADRRRLKAIMAELNEQSSMAVILRTAGSGRTKAEIRRDHDYLSKLWEDIREQTLKATAPTLIHEEGSLIKRILRDMYSKDMEEVLVAGEEGYRLAKDFMKSLIPSHARRVKLHRDEQATPLFQEYAVEQQLTAIYDPTVRLPSGGSIVIQQTEALVSIDVNSGRAIRERHIEETAFKTNLEAADEVARQLRLRDLAGLVVVDFIDMEESRNNAAVERRLKDATRQDRARIQIGRISGFGLMEMSRQRLRPSLMETITQPCPQCGGAGYIQSTESAALHALRALEEEAARARGNQLRLTVGAAVALYITNHKRAILTDVETRHGLSVALGIDPDGLPTAFSVASEMVDDLPPPSPRARRAPPETVDTADDGADESTDSEDERASAADSGDGESEENGGRRRRRRRRGGRRRGGRGDGERGDGADASAAAEGADEAPSDSPASDSPEGATDTPDGGDAQPAATEGDGDPATPARDAAVTPDTQAARPRARRVRRPFRRADTWRRPATGSTGATDTPATDMPARDAVTASSSEPSLAPPPVTPATAAPVETPPPAEEPAAPATGDSAAPAPEKSRRQGWWNRMVGGGD